MAENNNRRFAIFIAALSALFTFLVYIPSLGNGFVNWDDPSLIYKNPRFGHLDIIWALTARAVGNWHPATILSLELDRLLWGFDPFGYHLTNVILHSLNSFLAGALSYMLCRRVIERPGRAAVAIMTAAPALLFGLHPAHVESVAWISERKDVLSSFFILLTFLLYLRYAQTRTVRRYGLCLAAFVLALLSKPMAVSVPAALLVLDYYPLRRMGSGDLWRVAAEKAPFVLLSAAIAGITIWAQQAAGAVQSIDAVPLIERLTIACRAALFYIYKLILPWGLAPYYPVDFNTGPLMLALYGLVIILLTGICVYFLRWSRAPFAAWIFYLVTLLPVIGLVTVGAQAAADRYTYLPTLGFLVLLGGGLAYFAKNNGKRAASVLAAMAPISALLAFLTIGQTGIWKDSLTLWSYEIGLHPGMHIAYINRAIAYGELGRADLAYSDLTEAIRLKPDDIKTYYNRARALSMLQDYRGAIADLTRAIELKPSYADAYNNRGTAFAALAEYEEAGADFMRAVEFAPNDATAQLNLGMALMKTGDRTNAAIHLMRAHELGDPSASVYLKEMEY